MAVFKEQRYDKCKQFTTFWLSHSVIRSLFSKSKDTINASNSQLQPYRDYTNTAVFKEQRYDKCKQFTTMVVEVFDH